MESKTSSCGVFLVKKRDEMKKNIEIKISPNIVLSRVLIILSDYAKIHTRIKHIVSFKTKNF